MKNKALLFLIALSLMLVPVFSFAQPNDTSTNVKNRNGVRTEERERIGKTIKDEIEAKREAVRDSVEERRQNAVGKIVERINQFTRNVIARHEAAIKRLETLLERIESRIAKMEAVGIEVTEARGLVDVAQTKIDTAKASVAGITSVINDISFGTTTAAVKEDFGTIKDQIEMAKRDIKAAHAALVDIVNSLKPGFNKMKGATTTTEDDNPD